MDPLPQLFRDVHRARGVITMSQRRREDGEGLGLEALAADNTPTRLECSLRRVRERATVRVRVGVPA